METSILRPRSLVKATAAALAAAAFFTPAGAATPAAPGQSDGGPRDAVGYRTADGALRSGFDLAAYADVLGSRLARAAAVQIGKESCRERGEISEGPASLHKK